MASPTGADYFSPSDTDKAGVGTIDWDTAIHCEPLLTIAIIGHDVLAAHYRN